MEPPPPPPTFQETEEANDNMLGMPAPAFTSDPASESADLLGEAGFSSAPAHPPPPPAPAMDLLGMGDLLGGMDDSSNFGFNPVDRAPPSVPQFSLAQGVTMAGPQFEGHWSQLPLAQN